MTVELRIHGVGGASPEGLLGERHPDDVIELRRGHRTGLWARRRDPSVQGYVWGGLTSGAKLQPLWIVLLPFTLVNMAGWMHPPLDGTAALRRQVNDIRRLVTMLGYTLTVTWSVWLAVVVGDFLVYQGGRDKHALAVTAVLWGLGAGAAVAAAGVAWKRWLPLIGLGALVAAVSAGGRFVDHATARAVAGVLAAQGLLAVLVYISGISRRQYESYPPAGPAGAAGPSWATRRITSDEGFESPAFFGHPDESRRLLISHIAALVVTTALLIWRAAVRAGNGESSLDFGSWVMALGGVQYLLLIALAVRSFGDWGRQKVRWRYAGPAAAAGLAFFVTNAVFTGLAVWTARRVKGVHTGAERALADMYVFGVLVLGVILLLAWLPYFLSGGPEPPAGGESADELAWRGTRYRRQRLSRAFRSIDLLVTALAAWFVIAGIVATLTRLDLNGSVAPWHWSIDPDGGISPIRGAGAWLLPFLVPALGIIVRTGARSTGARRNIGNLWDVAGLWPRRFHPFAVRPYAERAVPELQSHLAAILADPAATVVVSAHSQGSVLAFVALTGMTRDPDVRRVALVTYGSPLSRLHARFFPAYVGPDQLDRLRHRVHSWRNFFHRTDHIGQAVFGEDPAVGVDVALADPAEGPLSPGSGQVADTDEFIEPDRTPWRGIAGHNEYPREPALKAWVDDVKKQLGRSMGA